MKLRGWLVALFAVCATLAPVVRSADGFPLSNYPMFVQVRPDVTAFDVAVGIDSEGKQHRLSPSLVGGSIEVIQALVTVEDAVTNGTAGDLCQRIAARVALDDDELATVSVEVITEIYEIVPALTEYAPPIERTVHARCSVPR